MENSRERIDGFQLFKASELGGEPPAGETCNGWNSLGGGTRDHHHRGSCSGGNLYTKTALIPAVVVGLCVREKL